MTFRPSFSINIWFGFIGFGFFLYYYILAVLEVGLRLDILTIGFLFLTYIVYKILSHYNYRFTDEGLIIRKLSYQLTIPYSSIHTLTSDIKIRYNIQAYNSFSILEIRYNFDGKEGAEVIAPYRKQAFVDELKKHVPSLSYDKR